MYVGDYRFGERLVKAVDYGREVNSFVARYNGQGVLTWLKQFPLTGSGFEYFPTHTPITADRDGNIYLAAPFTQTVRIDTFVLNYVPALEPNRYYNDVLVARFNAVGQAQWVKKIGGANRERPSAIALDPQQHVIVAGQYTTATLSFDGHVITNNSGNDDEDVFVAKLSNPGPVVCLPTTVAIEAPPAFCEGDSVRITAKTTRAYSFLWLRDREVVEAAYDSTLFTKAGGVFQLVINPFTACADTSAAIAVNRIEKPGTTLTLSADSVLCPGEQLTLSAPVHQTYTYQWYKDGQALPGQTRPTLRAGEAGAYYVQIANQNQCPQNSGVQRVVTVPRQEDFLPDTVYRCIDQPEKLTPTLNDFRGTFRWSTGETSESITPPAPGSYVLRLTQHDCVYTDSVRIVEVPALFVPNVITPNADGKNDFFFIRNLLPGTALEIYNRFGTLVYRKAEYQNDWDGGEVPAGVYFYLLRSAHSCARPKVAKGWVQVLR
jgi:gliding motility-associated-like protein